MKATLKKRQTLSLVTKHETFQKKHLWSEETVLDLFGIKAKCFVWHKPSTSQPSCLQHHSQGSLFNKRNSLWQYGERQIQTNPCGELWEGDIAVNVKSEEMHVLKNGSLDKCAVFTREIIRFTMNIKHRLGEQLAVESTVIIPSSINTTTHRSIDRVI